MSFSIFIKSCIENLKKFLRYTIFGKVCKSDNPIVSYNEMLCTKCCYPQLCNLFIKTRENSDDEKKENKSYKEMFLCLHTIVSM